MEKLTELLLSQYGVVGGFLIALAMYLLKKEVYFAQERKEFIASITLRNKELQEMIDKHHQSMIGMIQTSFQMETNLRSTISDLANNVLRLEGRVETSLAEMRHKTEGKV